MRYRLEIEGSSELEQRKWRSSVRDLKLSLFEYMRMAPMVMLARELPSRNQPWLRPPAVQGRANKSNQKVMVLVNQAIATKRF
ncbi:hypothetical protein MTR_5g007705 [Medicago truncatula]|uniref:Uncharacterized protein n=1 Tax=Medicago truncatula TaxID=3880 RepID=A0A072UE84_MEDTR|nr:hypothetical protein MTR_5g007705 [Medicago truncatula]